MILGQAPLSMVNKLLAVSLTILSFILICLAMVSLHWRLALDSPIFLYIAFLMDRYHYIPYRDIFDVNLPGTYFINLGIGKFFGYDDFAYRCADLVYLAAILATTAAVMRKFGWKSAWSSAVIFGLLYLWYGPFLSMQRDYLIILPLALALLVSTSLPRLNYLARAAGSGLFLGLATTIKPMAAMALPFFLVYLSVEKKCEDGRPAFPARGLGWLLGAAAAGFAAPFLALVWYLVENGAWSSLVDMAVHYWPLYQQLTGARQILSGPERVQYLLKGVLVLGKNPEWLLPALLGSLASLFYAGRSARDRRTVIFLVALTFCFSLYPLTQGKFFPYHWLPFYFFSILLSCLGFTKGSRLVQFEPILLLLILILLAGQKSSDAPAMGPRETLKKSASLVLHPRETFSALSEASLAPPKNGRVDEIAAYLKSHLQPGDRVQPLDWTSGVLQAMLLARARPATPFLYDVEFYHHVSNPYIQDLRRRFIAGLQLSQPQVIIEVIAADKPFVTVAFGSDTTQSFPELSQILQSEYTVALAEKDFKIYRRK